MAEMDQIHRPECFLCAMHHERKRASAFLVTEMDEIHRLLELLHFTGGSWYMSASIECIISQTGAMPSFLQSAQCIISTNQCNAIIVQIGAMPPLLKPAQCQRVSNRSNAISLQIVAMPSFSNSAQYDSLSHRRNAIMRIHLGSALHFRCVPHADEWMMDS